MDLILNGSTPPKAPESWMKRLSKPMLLLVSVSVALVLTFLHHDEQGVAGAAPFGNAHKAPSRKSRVYDISTLRVFNRALTYVKEHYVDPSRMRPRQMLISALNNVERTVAEVLVEEIKDKDQLRVRVGTKEKTFDIGSVEAPWELSDKLKHILRFIQTHLRPDTDVKEVEYAAINGMLETLDPHSLLLKPEIYKEMRLSTRGEFGGLGIVISMVRGVLTVINPMKDTPAHRAGIKSCDQILKIEQESTVNMTLNQAVSRLRGTPGSKVVVTINRAGWSRSKRKVLTRAVIKVPSVDSRMLDKKVGYIRLRSFQGNSNDDIRQALTELRGKGMRALVLDLRGNPGGLLDQAVRISDIFIESGTLLTTVSYAGKGREEKRARREATEPRYPMAVLVSSGSASASEIVAGALKNLDRAVVIGNRTFGKGSVQVLYDNDDGSALKLTIAQYLTPGDVSIQSVGITPDIQTSPMVLNKDFIRLMNADYSRREQDLDKHLTNSNVRKGQKSNHTVLYLAEQLQNDEADDEDPNKEPDAEPSGEVKTDEDLCLYPDRTCKPKEEDKFRKDFQIRLAQDLVGSATAWRRSQLLAGAGPLLKRHRAAQQKKVADKLKEFGVDWSSSSPAKSSGKPKLKVSVSTTPAAGKASACRPMRIKVTVKNEGDAPANQLQAISRSTNAIFKNHEFVFGKVAPGQSRSWEVPIKIRDAATRVDDVKFEFKEQHGNTPEKVAQPMSIQGVQRPVFSYAYQLIDDVNGGNRDGMAQRGEQVRLFVRVRNSGEGASLRTITTLKNLSGEGIFLRKGRFELGRLEPGQSKAASFTLDVQRAFAMDSFKLELTVYDDGLREYTSEKLKFMVAKHKDGPQAAKGSVRVSTARALFHAWPADDAPVVGAAMSGASFMVLGRTEGWWRVQASKGRPAFIAAKEVTPGGRAGKKGVFKPRWQVTPPKLTIKVPTYSTDKSELTITGRITDETQVTDTYIFVRNPDAKIHGQKIFYMANPNKAGQMDFSAKVPLWKGANYVTVYARETEDVLTQETVVIYRK